MVRTRAGATTTAQFDFGALPDELQERICGYAGRDAITLSMVSRATRGAEEHLVNGLLKTLGRPNGAAVHRDRRTYILYTKRYTPMPCGPCLPSVKQTFSLE